MLGLEALTTKSDLVMAEMAEDSAREFFGVVFTLGPGKLVGAVRVGDVN